MKRVMISGCLLMSKNISQEYQAVFFDFDGVILDSVDVKTRAYTELFRPFGPEAEKAAVDYHLANGGLSRFKKFEYIFKHVLKQPVSEKELEKMGQDFSDLALKGVLESPFIPGALETLKELKEKNIPAFVVSGTPDEEIKYIVKKKGLEEYFKEVHGSPRAKAEIVLDILRRYSCNADKCLFIGDAMSDYQAAKIVGLAFFGVLSKNCETIFPPNTKIDNKVSIF